jgi:hypothetical protein
MAGLALILDGIATLTTREECCEEAVKERKVELGGYFRRRRRMSLEEKEQLALGNSAMTTVKDDEAFFSRLGPGRRHGSASRSLRVIALFLV